MIPTLRNNRSRLDKTVDAGGSNGNNLVNIGGGRISEIGGTIDENSGVGSVSGADINNSAIEEQGGDINNDQTTDGTEEMTERDIREAAQMNDHLGKQVVSNRINLLN